MEHNPTENERVQFAVTLYTELIVRGVACRLDDVLRLVPEPQSAITDPPPNMRPTPDLPEAA